MVKQTDKELNHGKKFSVIFDSSESFTYFKKTNIPQDRWLMNSNLGGDVPVIYPPSWDKSYNTTSVHGIAKIPSTGKGKAYPEGTDNRTNYDIENNRIPLREVFFNTKLII